MTLAPNMKSAPEVVSFGCRLNIAESEQMGRLAAQAGLTDTVIVNTCAVTAEAERQAGQAIRRLKRERPDATIIVSGCASQIDAEKYARMAEVSHVIANDAKLLPQSFQALREPNTALAPTALAPEPGPDRAALQRAFIQVQNGCDHRCTFCIIPFGRGASRSLSIDAIVARARHYTDLGFNELVLTGVDIASYGRDLADRPTLGQAVRALLAALPHMPRLRLSSLDPAAIDLDLWDLIAHEPRLMPHLHLSLQAGDDLTLKRMKRRHNRDDVFRLCDRARTLRPDIAYGADVIAGFPTETDAMFDQTYDLIDRCGFLWLHVFPYSSREGTPAARMPQLNGDIRRARAERLRLLGEAAVAEHHRNLIGQTVSVLVENNRIGCTPQFARVRLDRDGPLGALATARCRAVADNGEVQATLVTP